MQFLVTGATGFVGGAVVRQLTSAGHTVRALVRSHNLSQNLIGPTVTYHTGDVADRASLEQPMAGVDGVFHIAGWYKVGVRDPHTANQVNVEGTKNVLETMRALGIPKGVYTSTLAVNSDTHGRIVDESYRFTGTHISLYDRSKAEAHNIAAGYAARGLPLVIVQPGLVYGPGDTSSIGTMLRRFLRHELPPLPARTAFCWGHIDDIARGHILAMDRGQAGRNYFLAGPVSTLVEAIEIAHELTGIAGPSRTISPAILKAAAAVMGVLDRVIRLPPEYTGEGLRVLAGTTYIGTAERACRELGWSVRSLRDGLSQTLEHEIRQLGMTAT